MTDTPSLLLHRPAWCIEKRRTASRAWGDCVGTVSLGVIIMRLSGKVALITGAASGIGHAIAKRYLEADGRVVIADLDAAAATRAAGDLADKKSAIGVRMDVSDGEQVNAGVAQAVAAFGTIDILVSNAGIQIVHPIEDFPFAEWKRLL